MPDSTKSGPTTAASRRPTDRQGQELPQLSCDLCRERKVKCDKLDPCTNCTLAGVPCITIFRNRLPRGRYANRAANSNSSTASNPSNSSSSNTSANASRQSKKSTSPTNTTSGSNASQTTPKRGRGTSSAQINKELRQRIQRLESIVQNQSRESSSAEVSRRNSMTQGPSAQDQIQSLPLEPTQPLPFQFTATPQPRQTPLWTDLIEEPQINDAQLQSQFKDIFSFDALEFARPSPADSGLGAFGTWDPLRNSRDWVAQNTALAAQLCRIFLAQVDPIIKILHRPSVERWLIQGDTYLHYAPGHAAVQALGTSIAFMAVSSMTDRQCAELLPMGKQQLLDDTCKACESALAAAGLLSTQDITVLQAFVLFMTAKRCQDRSLAIWTIVSLAVRIGQNLGIDDGQLPTHARSPTFYEQQMRKRLWLTICSLDYQTALLQGSPPMVRHESVRAALDQLRHVNDSDFGPSTTQPVNDREELTDITFAFVLFHLQLSGRLLNYLEFEASKITNEFDTAFAQLDEHRKRYAREFEEKALGALRFCDPESSVFAWFTWHGTQCFVAAIRSWTIRPMPKGQPVNQMTTLLSENGNTDLFRTTLKVLEKNHMVHTDARGEGFRWHAVVPWPLVATAFTEFCVCEDAELAQRAWPLLEATYQHLQHISLQVGEDASQTVLCQLMERASAKMAGSPGSASNVRHSPPFAMSTSSVLASPIAALPSTDSLFDANIMAMAVDTPMFGHSVGSDSGAHYMHHSMDSGTYLPDMRMLDASSGKPAYGIVPDNMHTGRRVSESHPFANSFGSTVPTGTLYHRNSE